MKMCPVGAELFHADRRTGKNEEVNSRFTQFCERAQKWKGKIEDKITMILKVIAVSILV
jgi:hypothetical protein